MHLQPEQKQSLAKSTKQTVSMFVAMLPIIVGVILLTSLIIEVLPIDAVTGWFGGNDVVDALVGALFGSISAGHPLTSYVLGGELLQGGVSLVAITAFLISWVTVGSIQLPAEAITLGWRFALYRNLMCFLFSIIIAVLVMTTLRLLG
jgi:uncharacterized membrane protein YraQ (UPF0718 family)